MAANDQIDGTYIGFFTEAGSLSGEMDAGGGYDTLVFNRSSNSLWIRSLGGNSIRYSELPSQSSSSPSPNQLNNVERVVFTDLTYTADANGNFVSAPTIAGQAGALALTNDDNDVVTPVGFNAPASFYDGMGGQDSLRFFGSGSDVSFAKVGDTYVVTRASDGTSVKLSNIEKAIFTDTTFTLQPDGTWLKSGGGWETATPTPPSAITLTAGDDSYSNVAGVEHVDGAAGTDTVVMGMAAVGLSAYTSGGYLVLGVNGTDQIAIKNIEKVVFTDLTFTADGAGGWHTSPTSGGSSTTPFTTGDDTYADKAGNESVDGLAGVDTVTIAQSAAGLGAVQNADGSLTLSLNGTAVITIKNIEKVAFTDVEFTSNGSGGWTSHYTGVAPAFTTLTAGDDSYIDQPGIAEKIDGLAGTDTVTLGVSATLIDARTSDDGFLMIASGGQDLVGIRNVERVVFTDATLEKQANGSWAHAVNVPAPSGYTTLTNGNDIYQNRPGVEKIDGLAGNDTVVIQGSAFDLVGSSAPHGYVSLAMKGIEDMQIKNIERVMFNDATLVLDSSGTWSFHPAGFTPDGWA